MLICMSKKGILCAEQPKKSAHGFYFVVFFLLFGLCQFYSHISPGMPGKQPEEKKIGKYIT